MNDTLYPDKRIAVIGSGVVGSSAAWLLANQGNQRAYEVSDLTPLTRQNAVDLGGAIFGAPQSLRSLNAPQHVRQCRAPAAALPRIPMPKPGMIRQSSCYTTPTQATVMRECSQPLTPPPNDTEEMEEEN